MKLSPPLELALEAELKLAYLKGYEEGKREERKRIANELNPQAGVDSPKDRNKMKE